MKYHKYFDDQFDDEEMLYLFRHHPVIMRKHLVIASVMLLLGVLPATIWPDLGFGWFFGGLGIGALVGAFILFYGWITYHFTIYIVTNQRFISITQKGLFKRSVSDIGLNKVLSTSYSIDGLQETLLGFGTIIIQTYVGEYIIREVHHPGKINNKIAQILRDLGFGNIDAPAKAEE